jgi:hypothetical protein
MSANFQSILGELQSSCTKVLESISLYERIRLMVMLAPLGTYHAACVIFEIYAAGIHHPDIWTC